MRGSAWRQKGHSVNARLMARRHWGQTQRMELAEAGIIGLQKKLLNPKPWQNSVAGSPVALLAAKAPDDADLGHIFAEILAGLGKAIEVALDDEGNEAILIVADAIGELGPVAGPVVTTTH